MSAPTPDQVAAYLAEVRERAAATKGSAHGYVPRGERLPSGPAGEWLIANLAAASDIPHLLAAVEAVLADHRSEPLYAHADEGECGCPVPTENSDLADEVWYDGAHPEGYGPDGTGLVCSKKVVGHWCPGCGNIAVAHGCFEVPKAYPVEKCPVRAIISRRLLGDTQ